MRRHRESCVVGATPAPLPDSRFSFKQFWVLALFPMSLPHSPLLSSCLLVSALGSLVSSRGPGPGVCGNEVLMRGMDGPL